MYDGPMQGGYSTNLSGINKFVKNTYLLTKLMATMKKKLRVLISSKHKETTLSGKRLHELTIVSMIQQLERYLNPFDEQPVRNFKTKQVIEENIIKGLLSSSILVKSLLLEFINKRLLPPEVEINQRVPPNPLVDFFSPIKNPNLKTGLKKNYPLTSVSLALAFPDGDLRQGLKAALRNYLISEFNALSSLPVQKAKWIIECMSVIRSM